MTDAAYLAAVRAARLASTAAREEASRRIPVEPVAHAVWTLLRNLQDAAEPTPDLNERLLAATAGVLALVDGEGRRRYAEAVANLRDREKWKAWWCQQPMGVGSSVTDLADYLEAQQKETHA